MFERRANSCSFPSLPLVFLLNATNKFLLFWYIKSLNIFFFVQVIQAKKAFDEDKVMAATSETMSDLLLNDNKSYLNDDNNKENEANKSDPIPDDNKSELVPNGNDETNNSNCFDEQVYPIENENDNGMTFIYETTTSNDTSFDFMSGPMINFSRPMETFGSVENLSLDDFYQVCDVCVVVMLLNLEEAVTWCQEEDTAVATGARVSAFWYFEVWCSVWFYDMCVYMYNK